ncbi:amidohydrolase family protein [Sphingorhabdus sp. EL138]|uniref:amidohydrolase family protein n=1 Tax=Sphingorhabdus sp. EL138 TaxID=2073156 RepID=UPI001C1FA4A3|nr:amidohydrolase family protein [Sphingorhabdus sp. EL138]
MTETKPMATTMTHEKPQSSHRVGRIVHDADSHITDAFDWLAGYGSDYVKENMSEGLIPKTLPGLQPLLKAADERLAGNTPDLTEELKSNIFGHKVKLNQFAAYGAVDKKERSEALDIMGIQSQLVFPLAGLSRFAKSKDLRLVYEGSEALNRGMADFCCDDDRLLPVGFISLADPEKALVSLKQAIDFGIKAIWLLSDAVDGRAPSHRSYDPLWVMMEEAGVPIVLHIGSGANMTDEYMNTGVKRNLEGSAFNIETTKPKDLNVLHHSIERWMTCMIYDGVLERFPKLKIGLIELGSNWIPAMMMNLDMGVKELGKFDVALRDLSIKPSDYVRRQVRVTPFHMEDTGWVLRNVGKDILMFNTDYPHPEGGSDPFGDFERSLDAVDATSEELDRFYSKNFEDLMGL